MVRIPSTMITEKLEGRNIYLELISGESLEGVLDQVTSYELGLRTVSDAIVVFRHAIKSVRVRENEVMGIVRDCCEEHHILGSDYIGYEVIVKFIDGSEVSGRLISISRSEIAIVSEGYAYILNKGSISYVRLIG
jgi:sRNA-binding regulator protein Hfq